MSGLVRLLRAEWRLLAFGFLMTAGSSFGQTFFIALSGAAIRADLELSHGVFGALYSTATLASAGVLLFSGSLIDRLPLQRYVLLTALALAGGCALLAGAGDAFALLLALFLLRQAGQGLMMLAGTTSVVRYIEDDRGKASAVAGSGYTTAEALLPVVAVAVTTALGWRVAWCGWALALLLVLLPVSLALLHGHDERHRRYLHRVQGPDRGGRERAQRPQWTRAQMVRDPLFYLYLPALTTNPIFFTGFIFHQGALIDEKGWSSYFWASLFLTLALSGWLSKLATGFLIDRLGAARLLPIVLLPIVVGLMILGVSDHPAGGAAFMVLLGVTGGAYTTLATPFFAERYGTLHLGAIKSLTTALMVLATAISPVAMGLLLDRGATLSTMALIAAGCALAASLLAHVANGRAATGPSPGDVA